MDSKTFYNNIKIKRPKYSESKSKLVSDILARKGSSKVEFTRFGPIYQVFMYAFMLGFHTDNRIELTGKTRDFLEIGKWRPRETVDIILMMIFSRTELIGYSWSELEELDEEELNQVIKDIVTVMEEYANGGLNYLDELLENHLEEFRDPFAFVNILKEIINNN